MALTPIRPDNLRSRPPKAATMLDTIRGKMRHLSIRRNRSPGKVIYIISRSDHGSTLVRKISPRAMPTKTDVIVNTVSMLERRHELHFPTPFVPQHLFLSTILPPQKRLSVVPLLRSLFVPGFRALDLLVGLPGSLTEGL